MDPKLGLPAVDRGRQVGNEGGAQGVAGEAQMNRVPVRRVMRDHDGRIPVALKRSLAAGRPTVVVIETASPEWSEAPARAALKIRGGAHVVDGENGKRDTSRTPTVNGFRTPFSTSLT